MGDIHKFIKDTNECIDKDNVADNYCIIVYTINRGCNDVRLIYKTINDFENKVEKDLEDVDEMFGILFELWAFD